MEEKLNKFWEWINGKKTIVGIIGHAAWFGICLSSNNISTETAIQGHYYIGVVTGVGGIHKLIKFFKK